MPAVEAEIKRQHAAGVDFIKLYTGLSHEQLEQASQVSQALGLPTIGHLEKVSWTDATRMGINNIVHAFPVSPDLLTGENRVRFETQGRPGTFTLFEWYEAVDFNSEPMQELFSTLRDHKVSVDPTLVVFRNTFFANSPDVTAHPKLNLVHPSLIDNWKDLFNFNTGWREGDYKRAQQVWPKVLELIRLLHQSGVMLTVGTDAANPWVIPGFSMHQEMQLFVDAGIDNWDVLQMATLNGAKLIGKQAELGSLSPGKFADFIILEANPADKIQHTQRIVSVYQNGKLIHSSH